MHGRVKFGALTRNASVVSLTPLDRPSSSPMPPQLHRPADLIDVDNFEPEIQSTHSHRRMLKRTKHSSPHKIVNLPETIVISDDDEPKIEAKKQGKSPLRAERGTQNLAPRNAAVKVETM